MRRWIHNFYVSLVAWWRNELFLEDYTLRKGCDCCWITIDNISVYLRRTDEGVVVDLFALGVEDCEPMATTYAFFQEAEDEIKQWSL